MDSEDVTYLGEKITEACRFAFDEYKTKVVGIINDNDSSIKAGAEKARDVDGNKLLQATCFSHSGNLLIKSLVLLDPTFSAEAREVIGAFDSSKMAALIKQAGGTKLKNFPDTRFCFFRNTCEGILKNLQKGTLQDISKNHCIAESVKKLIGDKNFRIKLKSSIRTLSPICKLINACQDPSKNIADGTEMWLNLRNDNPEITEEILKRILKAISEVGYAANLMHHIYQGKNMDDDQKFVAERFLQSNLNQKGKNELENFLRSRQEDDLYTEKCEKPIFYWRVKELRYPNLAKFCIKLFLFPASTASIEGFFSLWTFVHNRYRNRLGSEKSSMLANLFHMLKHLKNGECINNVGGKKRKYIEMCEDDSDDYFDDDDDDDEDDDDNIEHENGDKLEEYEEIVCNNVCNLMDNSNHNYMNYLLESSDEENIDTM